MAKTTTRTTRVLGLGICAFLIHVPSAHAYLDPGTGSMIIQGIVGVIAGAAVVGRLYWEKIKGFFPRRRTMAEQDGNNASHGT